MIGKNLMADAQSIPIEEEAKSDLPTEFICQAATQSEDAKAAMPEEEANSFVNAKKLGEKPRVATAISHSIEAIYDEINAGADSKTVAKTVRALAKEVLQELPYEERIAVLLSLRKVDDAVTPEFTEPTREPVTISDVYREVVDYLKARIQCAEDVLKVLALFAVATWFTDRLDSVPYLYLHSEMPGSGKTTAALALSNLCFRAVYASQWTPASLADISSQFEATTFIDEIDINSRKTIAEFTAILDAGTHRGGFRIKLSDDRVGANRHSVRQRCFGFKVLIGLKENALLPQTVERCIVVRMQKNRRTVEISPFEKDEDARFLRQKCAAVAEKYGEAFSAASGAIDAQAFRDCQPRTRQKYGPLLKVATLLGEEGEDVFQSVLTFIMQSRTAGDDNHEDRAVLHAIAATVNRFVPLMMGQEPNLQHESVGPSENELRESGQCKGLLYQRMLPEKITLEGLQVSEERRIISKVGLYKVRGSQLGLRAPELLAALLSDPTSPLHFKGWDGEKVVRYPTFVKQLKRLGITIESNGSSRYVTLESIQKACLMHLDGERLAEVFFKN